MVRHAIAEPRRAGHPDAERALTEKGASHFRKHVEALRRLEVRFDAVRFSPWRRAAETAALLAPLSRNPPEALEALAATPDERLRSALAGHGDATVAVVGHEPWLSELTAWLVVGDRDDGEARFAIKKGAVLHLSGAPQPGRMQLRAAMPPKLLRLAGS